MEELKSVISVLFNPIKFHTNEEKQQAEQYSNNIIQSHKTDYSFFFNLMEMCPDIYIQFWALSALEVIIKQHYPSYPIELRKQLHDLYFLMLEKKPMIIFGNQLIEQKYSFLFILLLKADYPQYWPEAFDKLLTLLNIEICLQDINAKFKYIGNSFITIIEFILRVFLDFEREIIDQYEAKTDADCLKAKEIKEEMRKKVINDIAAFLGQLVQNFGSFKESNRLGILGKGLEVMMQLIDWANLDLFVGNLPALVHFLGVNTLQTPSAKCLYSIIDKGMDAKKKLDMFDSLGLLHILSQWNPSLPNSNEEFGQMVTLF